MDNDKPPEKKHVTPNELEIGFVTPDNMRANGVRTLAAWCLGRGASITSVVPCQLSRDVLFLLGPKHPERPD
jgi:hypothetical protein